MRVIEQMSGSGTATSSSGEQKTVRYSLQVLQQEIPCGTLDNPNATIPGIKEIRGRVDPVCFFGDGDVLLEMQDGRKMKFFFTNGNGSIALRSWIG